MFGILGESPSDAAALKVIVRRWREEPHLSVKTMGYPGNGEMLRKGARQLRLFADFGCSRFVVCHDADGPDPSTAFRRVHAGIIAPSGLNDCCIVVPVQELEAWILADIEAVTHVIPSWKPRQVANPESMANPKEHLARLSRNSKRRPLYIHTVHNPKMAEWIDLQAVFGKCPSFRPLASFLDA